MSNLGDSSCSIIMPVYNGEKFIAEAIESVLLQSFQQWELLIVDDASTDDTASMVETFLKRDNRIRFFRNTNNQGVSNSRNRAIAQATGEYIAFLDADDRWHPEKLAIQIAILQKNGDVCYTSYAFMDAKSNLTGKKYIVPSQIDFRRMLTKNVVGCSTVVMHSGALGQSTFRTDFAHEDYVLWLELMQKGCQFVGCTDILVRYRIVGGRSSNKAKAAQNRWKIYRDFLRYGLIKSSTLFLLYVVYGIRKYHVK